MNYNYVSIAVAIDISTIDPEFIKSLSFEGVTVL